MLAAVPAQAQGTFQNLNFEWANPVISPGAPFYHATAASALPYWTAALGGVEQTQVLYNGGSGGAPEVVLLGPPPPTAPFNPIDGYYSVLLTGSASASIPSISQTGLIPAGTQSLLFEAESGPGNGILEVQIGTQTIAFAPLATEPNYTVYGASISAWAGQREQLTFTALQDNTALNNWEIDDISFSTQAVPEPSPLALTGVGALLFALYRHFAPKRP